MKRFLNVKSLFWIGTNLVFPVGAAVALIIPALAANEPYFAVLGLYYHPFSLR